MRKWLAMGACVVAMAALGSTLLALPEPRAETAGDTALVVGKSYAFSGPGLRLRYCTVLEPPKGKWVKVKSAAANNGFVEGPERIHWIRLDAISVISEDPQTGK
jgi:hypothetical protein